MTYNVFGGTLSLTQSVNPVSVCMCSSVCAKLKLLLSSYLSYFNPLIFDNSFYESNVCTIFYLDTVPPI